MLSFVAGKFPKMTKYLTTVKWSHSIDIMSIQIDTENLELFIITSWITFTY